ncbi:MAG TPA: hypothetical protein VF516_29715, partial [Kofleriaceae bacterium]
ALGGIAAGAVLMTRDPPPLREEREPNDDATHANRIAAGVPVTGFLGKRHSPAEPDRDIYVVPWPSGSQRVVTVAVTGLPNIDITLGVTDGDGLHGATIDENDIAAGEVLHRRRVDGPLVITVTGAIKDAVGKDPLPVENVSDPYTLTVTEEAPGAGETEPNNGEADANPLVLTEEMRGYLDTRDDVDLLRWTGESGSYRIVVRSDGRSLVWRLPDGQARTPGATTVELHRGDVIRLERTDRGGKGAPGGDHRWSVVVTR